MQRSLRLRRARAAEASLADCELIHESLTRPDVFRWVFSRHVDAVRAYLVRRANESVGDDLVSEVFVRAFEVRHRFDRSASSARPWLYGIATNVLHHEWRRHGRGATAVQQLGARSSADELDVDALVARLDASSLRVELRAYLASLTAEQRDLLVLWVWEGLTYEELAVALGVPVGTVRSRISRLRAASREQFAPRWEITTDQPSKEPIECRPT